MSSSVLIGHRLIGRRFIRRLIVDVAVDLDWLDNDWPLSPNLHDIIQVDAGGHAKNPQ